MGAKSEDRCQEPSRVRKRCLAVPGSAPRNAFDLFAAVAKNKDRRTFRFSKHFFESCEEAPVLGLISLSADRDEAIAAGARDARGIKRIFLRI